ncbi:MAG: L-lactate permease [Gammaproteobacteria bacterium]|nr:L-lactate permease [Gammaproteobacteria bacterium]
MALLFSIGPIALLIYLMTRRNAVPSHVALPLTALVIYAIKLVYFGDDAVLVHANVIKGLLTALTPILIIWGAIFMFKTMKHSGAMATVSGWLNGVSSNPVAQLMIIGWAFSFMIEGASGFGTPAALAAPILVGLGFPALRVAVLTLVMNSVPVSFGAVGTPTWFGMGQLGLSEAEMLGIGFNTAIIHAVAALVVPPLALRMVVDWTTLRRNLGFVYLSVLACVVPYVALARFNYEFPALIAGMTGLFICIVSARLGVGLTAAVDADENRRKLPRGQLVKALFPLWATVLVLLVTRIEQLGLKTLLNDATPVLQANLGQLGQLSTSATLVLTVNDILGTPVSWVYQALYVPALVPFFLVSVLAFGVYRLDKATIGRIASETYQRMSHTIVALLGALVMVQLLMMGGDEAMVIIIGEGFASAAGSSWQLFAPLLGALGSFFSGSATISNLTFAGIQEAIAADLRLDRTVILSLQSVGAAMGNMVCINNIVAVCSILGLHNKEGWILKRTVVPMVAYAVVAGVAGLLL